MLLGGGFFYLDTYRSRIVDSRVEQAMREARLISEAISTAGSSDRDTLTVRLADDTGSRVRIYDDDGKLLRDSRSMGLRNFQLLDPDKQGRGQEIARYLDAGIDRVVGAPRAPLYREQKDGRSWADVATVLGNGGLAATVWRAPDRTPVITAAAPLPGRRVVMTTVNARDITLTVRNERLRISLVVLVVTLLSILLSLFLARTIVRPLRRLARAAVRVRLGRAREVVVPRLPSRRDELGMLARALSDMSLALRARIDAMEAFAADVTHELKNPLASLRSATDGLSQVTDPVLQSRLLEIVRDDVHRLDRLITDISEASRLDAQLSRAKFEPVDVVDLINGLLDQRRSRTLPKHVQFICEYPENVSFVTLGEVTRLERAFENLIDNAISFSPEQGAIRISIMRAADRFEIRFDDEGPGVPIELRETIFKRFQSIRPDGEAFGRHSGLGLAIARTIVEAHQGTIAAESRDDRSHGARFIIRLPMADLS